MRIEHRAEPALQASSVDELESVPRRLIATVIE
jgi:hypothetical protein